MVQPEQKNIISQVSRKPAQHTKGEYSVLGNSLSKTHYIKGPQKTSIPNYSGDKTL
jgi:hypothetical protein